MEDAEEEKALPPDQAVDSGHCENNGGGSKNNIPAQSKKRVHFGDEGRGTSDNRITQSKTTDNSGKSDNPDQE